MYRFFLTLCTFAAFIGCHGQPSDREQAATSTMTQAMESARLTEVEALSLLEPAPTFKKYVAHTNDSWSCIFDSINDDEALLRVGRNLDERFETAYTFKVLRTGSVYVLDTGGEGDDLWKLDFGRE